MKLVSFSVPSPPGRLMRIGALCEPGIIDLNLSAAAALGRFHVARAREIADALVPPNMLAFLAGGDLSLDHARRAVDFALGNPQTAAEAKLIYEPAEVKLHAPVPRPNSIRDTISFEGHMRNFERRTGKPTPAVWYERPIYYKGNPDSVIGPDEDIVWPGFTQKLDYELEFGVFIGRKGRNIPVEQAKAFIAGYVIFNDVSARDVLVREVSASLGPAKGKDFDTGNVMGPWLVTPDELDASDLAMEARINGEAWSSGRSSDMRWSFEQMISFISSDETLHPGDFIGSGTVANGCGDELERWIKPGDSIELEVEGLGVLRNRVVRRDDKQP